MPSRAGWPPMIWIGGAQGAGKSKLAWRLSRAYDLPLHPVDLWTYDHAARLPSGGPLDEELAQGPERAADAFEAMSRLRLPLVLADVGERGLADVPALVEGPQLSPVPAERLPAGHAVWLIPDPVRTRVARELRLASTDVPADRVRLDALRLRDGVLAERLRTDAINAGRPIIAVSAEPDWAQIRVAVETALLRALRSSPHLDAGQQLAEQRRLENTVAARQLRLWSTAVGLTGSPAYGFACECGTSRCSETWRATPVEYHCRAAGGNVAVSGHA